MTVLITGGWPPNENEPDRVFLLGMTDDLANRIKDLSGVVRATDCARITFQSLCFSIQPMTTVPEEWDRYGMLMDGELCIVDKFPEWYVRPPCWTDISEIVVGRQDFQMTFITKDFGLYESRAIEIAHLEVKK